MHPSVAAPTPPALLATAAVVPARVTAPAPPATRFTVVDVETSGLSVRRHRLLQVAAVTVTADGTVLDRWSTDVRALRVGPRHVHGINRRRAWRAPPFRTIAPELAERLDGTVVVAHHARFDWAFLGLAFRRAGVDAPTATRLCTLELSRSLDPDRQLRHGLGDLCERYGVERGRAHDALADAEATARVLPHLLAAAGVDDDEQLHRRIAELRAWFDRPRSAVAAGPSLQP